jgi:hypothetical protein
LPPLQLAVWLPRFAHWLLEQHSWQVPLQRKRLPPHLRSQLLPSQVAVALATVGHALHELVPHELTLLLSTQASPHL